MRIAFAGQLVSEDSPFGEIAGLRIASSLRVQSRRMVRAAGQRHRSLGAKRSQIEWEHRLTHATSAEAADYLYSHSAAVSGYGDATIQVGPANNALNITLTAAQLTATALGRSGLSTIHRYALLGAVDQTELSKIMNIALASNITSAASGGLQGITRPAKGLKLSLLPSNTPSYTVLVRARSDLGTTIDLHEEVISSDDHITLDFEEWPWPEVEVLITDYSSGRLDAEASWTP